MAYESHPAVQSMPAEHVAALHAVDLHVYFGVHGSRVHLPDHGPAMLGISDAEYARTAAMMATLHPERGDVYAGENAGFGFGDLLSYVRGSYNIAETSPYIDTTAFHIVGDSFLETPPPDAIQATPFYHFNPGDILAFAEEARRFRVISTADYSVLQAAAKGIRYESADATAAELQAWREIFDEAVREMPLWEAFAVGTILARAEVRFRDGRMVGRLGETATTMTVSDPSDPPRLNFKAGEGHRRGVTGILDILQVPYTAHELTPGYRWRSVLTDVGVILHMLPFIPSHWYEARRWVANARKQQKAQNA